MFKRMGSSQENNDGDVLSSDNSSNKTFRPSIADNEGNSKYDTFITGKSTIEGMCF